MYTLLILFPAEQFTDTNIFNMCSFMNLTNGTFIKRVTLKAVKYDADDEMLQLRALWAVFDRLKYYMMLFYNWWLNIVVRMQTKK